MKKIKLLIIIIILVSLVWYLFIKPHDYIVRFKIKTSPGTTYKAVEDWSLINKKTDSFTYTIHRKTPFNSIDETIELDNMTLNLHWDFNSINDSITKVVIGIIEKEHSIFNRITAPFYETKFKKKTINLIQNYKKGIETQLKEKIKVKYIGQESTPEISYAYLKFKDIDMHNKAAEMINKNDQFISFLNKHTLKDGDLPFLIITDWNLKESKIDFRYCFPIKQKDTLPFHEEIKFDKTQSKTAIKVIYNGNYATSDRGWLTLYEYAKKHDIKITNNPIEVFKNNPFNGGNELEWETEIYMPLAK